MSPLWPETVHVGLFPGTSWVNKRAKEVISFAGTPVHDPQALLNTLAAMLDAETNVLRKGSKVVVTTSDSIAAIAALPWQPSLTRTSELQGYARACFEKLGISISDDWTMHMEFRHYGAMGLAYALPNAWLAGLIDLLQAHSLTLQTVLPVTAAAYARRLWHRQTGKTLILLQETLRSSALVVDSNGLCGYDVEPVIGAAQESSVRLLKRIGTHHGEIGHVAHWSLHLPEESALPGFVSECLPGSTFHAIPKNAWSR